MAFSMILPTHTKAQQRQPQMADDFVAPNRLPRANHKKCLTLFCTRDNPKRLQNTPSGDIQAVSKQDKISFTNSISKGRSHQAPDLVDANFISWGQQSVHSGVD